MELYFCTWNEVESYLKKKSSLLIPVGSTEQHGPTGLIGTDFLTAWEVAKGVGQKTQTMVASPICYGMALHHMAFAGSATLKPSTFQLLIREIVQSYAQHGFRDFYFVNGHGGNIPSLQAAFSELLTENQNWDLRLYNWWHLSDVTAYESEVFGDQNGFHATCGEISATMHLYPEQFQISRPFEFFKTPQRQTWPQSPGQYRQNFPDGRMGSDPRLANARHGQILYEKAVDQIAREITAL